MSQLVTRGILQQVKNIYSFPNWVTNLNLWAKYARALTLWNDTLDNSVNIFSVTGTNNYLGAVLAPNGKIYHAPFGTNTILVIDTNNNTTYRFGNISGSNRYHGGALAPNGCIYLAPSSNTQVLKIDPTNDTATLIGSSYTGAGKWAGAVLANNGLIYCIPSNSASILVIDPNNDTTTIFGSLGTVSGKYTGASLAPDGSIYCAPNNATSILKINPSNNTTSTFGNFTGSAKWAGAIISKEGNIYGVPTASQYILKINTSNDTTSLIDTGDSLIDKFFGGALGTDGKIYMTPFIRGLFGAQNVICLDTTNDTFTTFGSNINGGGGGPFRYLGASLAKNGSMYLHIRQGDRVTHLHSADKNLDKNSILSRFYNKSY